MIAKINFVLNIFLHAKLFLLGAKDAEDNGAGQDRHNGGRTFCYATELLLQVL